MGVDAVVLVTSPTAIDDRQLLRMSYEVASAFGPSKFFIDREGKYSGPRHALSFDADDRYDWIDKPEDTATVIKVNVWSRYYGEGYERGDLPFLISLRRWFLSALPGCTVFYGGDTTDIAEPFTDEREAELWAHFVKHQHLPYISHRSLISDALDAEQRCEFCDEPMQRFGWGSGYASFACSGCGLHRETRDGGRTWDEKVNE